MLATIPVIPEHHKINACQLVRKLELDRNVSLLYYVRIYDRVTGELLFNKVGKSICVYHRFKNYHNLGPNKCFVGVVRLYPIQRMDAAERELHKYLKQKYIVIFGNEYYSPEYDEQDVITSIDQFFETHPYTHYCVDPYSNIPVNFINNIIKQYRKLNTDAIIELFRIYAESVNVKFTGLHISTNCNHILPNGMKVINAINLLYKHFISLNIELLYSSKRTDISNKYSDIIAKSSLEKLICIRNALREYLKYDIFDYSPSCSETFAKNRESNISALLSQIDTCNGVIFNDDGDKDTIIIPLSSDELTQMHSKLTKIMNSMKYERLYCINYFKQKGYYRLFRRYTINGVPRSTNDCRYNNTYNMLTAFVKQHCDDGMHEFVFDENKRYYYSYEFEYFVNYDQFREQDARNNIVAISERTLYGRIGSIWDDRSNVGINNISQYQAKYIKLLNTLNISLYCTIRKFERENITTEMLQRDTIISAITDYCEDDTKEMKEYNERLDAEKMFNSKEKHTVVKRVGKRACDRNILCEYAKSLMENTDSSNMFEPNCEQNSLTKYDVNDLYDIGEEQLREYPAILPLKPRPIRKLVKKADSIVLNNDQELSLGCSRKLVNNAISHLNDPHERKSDLLLRTDSITTLRIRRA